MISYVARWNPEQQKQYGSARGNTTWIGYGYDFLMNLLSKLLPGQYLDIVQPPKGIFDVKDYRGKVSIYDATGRKVAVSMIQDENSKLNLAYLPKGVYFVRPEDGSKLKKVVKVK